MGTYFKAVVELDDGPFPIIPPAHLELTLPGHLGQDDLRTRAVYAFIRDKPRRVWWVSDYTEFYEQLTDQWSSRLGSYYFRHSTIPQDVPGSTLDLAIVVNVDKREYFDGARFESYCPLPVLAASYACGSLPGGRDDPMAARWHGDHIVAHKAGAADLVGFTELHDWSLADW